MRTEECVFFFMFSGVTTVRLRIKAVTISSLDTHKVSTFISSSPKAVFQKCLVEGFLLWMTLSFPPSVGGWFLPSNGPICPSNSPPQFSGSPGHSSNSYCERYSSLRSHRASPYPSHYPHRSTNNSKTLL